MAVTRIKLYLMALCLLSWLSISIVSAQPSPLSISTSSIISANDTLNNLLTRTVDGPYLFRNKKGGKLVRFIQEGGEYKAIEETVNFKKKHSFQCVVENEDRDIFSFELKAKYKAPKSIYKQAEKLLAISDIEGNFNAFYSLLLNNGVMNQNYEWTFGEGHLVLVGDFMDRGENVTQVLWLIYKLEQEAEKQGGLVHFILGNHEVLNLEGAFDYVDKKYVQLYKKYTGKEDAKEACVALMNKNNELVRWMKSKNSIEKIGDFLFVHGGISQELLDSRLTIDGINNHIRSRLKFGTSIDEDKKQTEDFLLASHGPLWFRGLATRYRNYYKKATQTEVNRALKYFKVKHIVIGHTIANEVSTDYNGAVIRTDVKHCHTKEGTQSQALLVQNNQLFRVDGKGDQFLLNDLHIEQDKNQMANQK